MLQGRFEHNLDDKGRVAIPAAFRKELMGDDLNQLAPIYVTISDQCLAAYPADEWQIKVEKINKLNQLDPKVMAFKRIFIGCAHECQIDKAGRILIPQDLRRDVGIEKEAVMIGQIDKFEIWSKDRWDQAYRAMADQMGAISQSLADQGIEL